MKIADYTKFARTTAVYPAANTGEFRELLYLSLGLGNEAGEFQGKIKKMVRGDEVNPESVVSELGDVLWYLVRTADCLGLTLHDLADLNSAKLTKRVETNTIKGEGDDREKAA